MVALGMVTVESAEWFVEVNTLVPLSNTSAELSAATEMVAPTGLPQIQNCFSKMNSALAAPDVAPVMFGAQIHFAPGIVDKLAVHPVSVYPY